MAKFNRAGKQSRQLTPSAAERNQLAGRTGLSAYEFGSELGASTSAFAGTTAAQNTAARAGRNRNAMQNANNRAK